VDGVQLDGVILVVHAQTMRVAIRGLDDAGEFRYQGGQWLSESGDPIEITRYSTADGADSEVPDGLGGAFSAVLIQLFLLAG